MAKALCGVLSSLKFCPRRFVQCVVLPLVLLMLAASARAQTATFSYAQRAVAKTGLSAPHGVVVDSSGDIYIADTDHHRVLKETLQPDVSYAPSVVVNTGLSAPQGVAVDSSGNIYIADTGNNRVFKETVSGTIYTESLVTSTGLHAPEGVAVNGSGDVYIADTGNNRVLKEMPSGNTYIQSVVTDTGLSMPEGVAVDGSGNVYIADTGNNQVLKETISGSTYVQSVIRDTGLSAPESVAVNERGDVYIADTGHNRVLKERASGSTYLQSVFAKLGLSFPAGVAARGHSVYVADTANDRVLNLDPPANFGSIAVGTTSAAQTLVFTFSASATLASTPYAVLTQGVANLDFQAAATQPGTVCVAGQTYNSGNTCTVDVTFTPSVSGSRDGAAVLYGSSNTVIATAYAIGTGIGPQVTFLPLVQSTVSSTGFSNPSSLAVDGSNNVYVVDRSPANKVFKETLQSDGSYTQSAIASITGLSSPFGIEIDGAGDIYLADTGNNRLLIETLQPNRSYTQTVIATGITAAQDIAVDGSGNVYYANYSSSGNVFKGTQQSNGSYTQTTIASGLANPTGLAADDSGNVFVGETTGTSQRVLKETLQTNGSYVQTVIASGVNQVYAITIDNFGNLYYTDKSNNVWKETLQTDGSYVQSLFLSELNNPSGIAIDGNGNLFVTNSNVDTVLKFGSTSALTFTTTSLGSTSSDSPQTLTLENFGNAPLTFPIPSTGSNPSISTNFTLNSSGATACPLVTSGSPTSGTLAANSTCTLPVSFSPTVVGSLTGTLVLTDNHLNSTAPAYTMQTINLSGAGSLAIAPSSLPMGTYGSVYPPQNLTARVGTAPYTFVVTTGTLPPGLGLSGGVISGTPTAAGSHSFTITATDSTPAGSGGPFTGTANYTIMVNPTLLTATANNASRAYNTANPTFTYMITGFVNGDNSSVVSGTATLTTTATTTSPLGTYPITFSSGLLTAANYSFSHVNGTLTVVERSQTTIASLTSTTATINVFGFGFTPPSGQLAFTDVTSSTPVTAPVTLNTATSTTSLTTQATVSTGANTLPVWTELGDINGDGIPDLVTSLYQADSVRIQLGNGDGTFQAATTILIATGFGPAECHLVSLRGNGTLDLIVGSFNVNQIAVLLGSGNGTFGSPVLYTVGSATNTPTSLTSGDFNDDGHLDVAVANTGDNTVSILLGDGTGGLALSGPAINVGHTPEAIRAADFNADNFTDLAVANYDDGTVTILINDDDGTFTANLEPVGTGPQALAITGIGTNVEIAVVDSGSNDVTIIENNGKSGSFKTQTVVSVGKGPDDVSFADLNGDGIPDLVVVNYTDNSVNLALGSAGGSYTVLGPFSVGTRPYSAAVGDVDQDGTPDLVVSNCFSNNTGTLLSGTLISVPYSGLSLTSGHTLNATYTPDTSSKYAASTSSNVTAP